MKKPKQTKDEFWAMICERRNITKEEFKKSGFDVFPCDCHLYDEPHWIIDAVELHRPKDSYEEA